MPTGRGRLTREAPEGTRSGRRSNAGRRRWEEKGEGSDPRGAEGAEAPGRPAGGVTNLEQVLGAIDLSDAGERMQRFISEFYAICRSITGDGFRETLRGVGKSIPLEVHEVPTGTKVFDWTVPREWNIRDAWVKNARGEKVIDFGKSNLHVVNYSVPVRCKMQLSELRQHLHTIPDQPDWVPYRTSYYKESWGFCLAHSQLQELEDGEYEVCIDSRLEDGGAHLRRVFHPGQALRGGTPLVPRLPSLPLQ